MTSEAAPQWLVGPAAAWAEDLVESIRHGERVTVAVCGVHGTGKSALLRSLPAGQDAGADSRALLRVDDAQALGDEELRQLIALTDDDGPGIVVAYRPWPVRPLLDALVARLERRAEADGSRFAAVIQLGPLPAPIAADWYMQLDPGIAPGLARTIAAASGGMPWLLRDLATPTTPRPQAGDRVESAVTVSSQAVERVHRYLQHLHPAVYELALGLAAGFEVSGLSALEPAAAGRAFRGLELDEIVELARDAGILGRGDRLIPVLGEVLRQAAPEHRLIRWQLDLVTARLATGQPVAQLAARIVARGVRTAQLAQALTHAADAALTRVPRLAGELYRTAIRAGADAGPLQARRAQAALGEGDLAETARLLQAAAGGGVPADRSRALDVTAALWSHLGLPCRAAEVYGWAGGEDLAPESAATAALATLLAGDRNAATRLAAGSREAFPTPVVIAQRLMVEGIGRAIDVRGDAGEAALPALSRASAVLTATAAVVPLPDAPAALAALVALHAGNWEAAGTVLDAALEGAQGGPGAAARLRLLRAWAAMTGGDLAAARTSLEAVEAHRESGTLAVPPRDELLARALELGIARRGEDIPALIRAWSGVPELLHRVGVGLVALLPLAELVQAAARLRAESTVAPALEEAWTLLASLGDPPLWAVPLHWACVQAGIIRNRPSDLGPHAAALVAAAGENLLAARLAAAGRAWVAVLGGTADAATVERAVSDLADAGQLWDAVRLAGHAAGRAAERADMHRLLRLARELQNERLGEGRSKIEPGAVALHDVTDPDLVEPLTAVFSAPPSIPAGHEVAGTIGTGPLGAALGDEPPLLTLHAPLDPGGAAEPGSTMLAPRVSPRTADRSRPHRSAGEVESPPAGMRGLSAREVEVARMVLTGKTYREIGSTLFISPRTVEHHIARIRRRLGLETRAELLDHLRALFVTADH